MVNEKVVILRIKLTKGNILPALAFALLCLRPQLLGSETLTLTTYYPAPYGAYVTMLTTRQTLLARDGGSVGIGTRSPQAKLDISASVPPEANDGFILPRMNTAGRISLSGLWPSTTVKAAKQGLLVYDTDMSQVYVWNGEAWRTIEEGSPGLFRFQNHAGLHFLGEGKYNSSTGKFSGRLYCDPYSPEWQGPPTWWTDTPLAWAISRCGKRHVPDNMHINYPCGDDAVCAFTKANPYLSDFTIYDSGLFGYGYAVDAYDIPVIAAHQVW